MELKRRATLLTLYAACDETPPVCAEEGPAWDSSTPGQQAAMCQRCPVKKQCKAYADEDPLQTWGVWGGQLYPRTPKGKISHKDPSTIAAEVG